MWWLLVAHLSRPAGQPCRFRCPRRKAIPLSRPGPGGKGNHRKAMLMVEMEYGPLGVASRKLLVTWKLCKHVVFRVSYGSIGSMWFHSQHQCGSMIPTCTLHVRPDWLQGYLTRDTIGMALSKTSYTQVIPSRRGDCMLFSPSSSMFRAILHVQTMWAKMMPLVISGMPWESKHHGYAVQLESFIRTIGNQLGIYKPISIWVN